MSLLENIQGMDFSRINIDTLSQYVLKGFYFSATLTLTATVCGIVLGTLLAMMRLSSSPWLVKPATVYVNTFRSIPLVMVILWIFLLIPSDFYKMIGGSFGENYRKEISVLITFSVFEAAYFSEIMRAGIQSIPKGQIYAGYAVGMNYRQCMSLIVLPQAFRNMLPVLLTQTIILFQDTSLVYAIGASDMLKGFKQLGELERATVESYMTAALVYFIICFSLSMMVRRLQKKIQIIR
jgi:glutamate/aspartate transport system permease protein